MADQGCAILRVGMLAEGQDLIVGDDVLAVGESEELERSALFAALFSDQDDDAADAGHGGLKNARDLVDAIGIVAPGGLQEGLNLLLGGRVGSEIGGLGLGKGRAGCFSRRCGGSSGYVGRGRLGEQAGGHGQGEKRKESQCSRAAAMKRVTNQSEFSFFYCQPGSGLTTETDTLEGGLTMPV